MKLVLYTVVWVICFSLLGCGKDTTDENSNRKAQAQYHLDNKDYSRAISVLESLSYQDLVDLNATKLLVDSYLGYCHFDAYSLFAKSKKAKEISRSVEESEVQILEALDLFYLEIINAPEICHKYFENSLFLVEESFIDINDKNAKNFYIGNVYFLATLVTSKEIYSTIKNKNLDEKLLKEKTTDVIKNLEKSKQYYEQSYIKLRPIVELLETLFTGFDE